MHLKYLKYKSYKSMLFIAGSKFLYVIETQHIQIYMNEDPNINFKS